MTYQLDFELSPELEPYREKIEASIKPYLEIKLSDNSNPTWWQSKFGGLPYMPKNYEYPQSWDGEYLYLLAQINFAEIPSLDDFPHKGILQFYIADDGLYGADLQRPTRQNKFRVIYFADVDLQENNLITDFSFLPEKPNLPIDGCSGLEFIKKYAPMCIADWFYYDFSRDEMEMAAEISIFLDEKEEEDLELFADDGHKLGGYPFFVQDDPRPGPDYNDPQKDNYTLLLQIDTDSNENETISILWGDAGIGNFFIKRSTLKKLDFSDVIYNWDCA